MPSITNATITTTPLQLLRQIRDVMSSPASAQARLDQLVRIIATGFSSEVCSVYLLRAGDVLELFASQGLKASSVHLTRLSVGQGLVGEIAATATPLNLADAQLHHKYVYRPETGEEIYSSFVGVPVLQGGKVIGVLVVQGKRAHRYSDDQVEVLQTIAMVLSELAISGQLIAAQEMKIVTTGLAQQRLSGVAMSPGMARAPAVLHQPQLIITQYVAADIEGEKERFEQALRKLQDSFDRYIQTSNLADGDEQREIIETYLLFTQDRGWKARILEAISSGLTAEAGVRKVQEELQAKMSQLASPYIKERIQDLEDLSSHLLRMLLGHEAIRTRTDLPEAFILVARNIGPAELLDYDQSRLRGLVLEEGSMTSHTAVIARAMDIPALTKVTGATAVIQQHDMLIMESESGSVYVRPTDDVESLLEAQLRNQAERAGQYEALRPLPAITRDGQRIALNVNAGLFVDAKSVMQEGVEGIGLYRTELPYMTSDHFPDVERQRQHYAQIYEQLPGKRIIFRSFDIGGDKKVHYLNAGEEENPAMGWRATRIGLDHPGILLTQLRALIAAADGRALHVMFPFIAQLSELDAAHRLLERELQAAQAAGQRLPQPLKLGVMVEIPSLLWQLEALMEKVDFVSIGSNDLMQFLFACDRGAAHMAGHYDTLSPIFLRVVRQVVQAAKRRGVEVSFCGEMARKPLEALALIGLGVRSLSASASAIAPLKALVRSIEFTSLSAYMEFLLASEEASVRHWLDAYAKDHGIAL